jgi:hypothetical protein
MPGTGNPRTVKEPISFAVGVVGSSMVTDVVAKLFTPSVMVIGIPPSALPRLSRTKPEIDPVLGDN